MSMNFLALVGLGVFLFFTMPVIVLLGAMTTLFITAMIGENVHGGLGIITGAIWAFAYAVCTIGGVGYAVWYVVTM